MASIVTAQSHALRWIVDQLRALRVSFQAIGGLAARAYGARRPLQDLDFYVPTALLADVANAVAPYVVRPPMLHHDDWWDLTFMKLKYGGCKIELAGAEDARYFDRASGHWRPAAIDFSISVERVVLSVSVPIIPFKQLVMYKQRLGRDVDHQDIEDMLSARSGHAD